MKTCFGVDGCRGGWLRVGRDEGGRLVAPRLFADAAGLVEALPPRAEIGIDMPVGLPETGPRACDRLVRAFLGRPRGSSVFPAPLRAQLAARSYEDALARGRALDGRGLTIQTWNLLPKIRELDDALTSDRGRARRSHEVHPELAFALWAGAPIAAPKRSAEGRRQRLALVVGEYGREAVAAARAIAPKTLIADDDILDAFAVLWSVERIARGEERRFPERAPRDAAGLRMQIRG